MVRVAVAHLGFRLVHIVDRFGGVASKDIIESWSTECLKPWFCKPVNVDPNRKLLNRASWIEASRICQMRECFLWIPDMCETTWRSMAIRNLSLEKQEMCESSLEQALYKNAMTSLAEVIFRSSLRDDLIKPVSLSVRPSTLFVFDLNETWVEGRGQ